MINSKIKLQPGEGRDCGRDKVVGLSLIHI